MGSWPESIKRAMDRVHTTWAGIRKHLLDKTSPNIIFIWSGKVILGLGFASPNITLPDQINMILVSVLSNKCIILFRTLETKLLGDRLEWMSLNKEEFQKSKEVLSKSDIY